MRFAINSNLMAKPDLLDKMIAGTQNINRSPYIQVVKHMALKQNILETVLIGNNGLVLLKKFVVKQGLKVCI